MSTPINDRDSGDGRDAVDRKHLLLVGAGPGLGMATARRFAVGDHYLVVARLATHTERREHEPLLYHDGHYVTATPKAHHA